MNKGDAVVMVLMSFSSSEGANCVEEQEDLFVDGDEMLEEDEEDELLLARTS
jgi:hypothetical protein